jgi:hypothetical protein
MSQKEPFFTARSNGLNTSGKCIARDQNLIGIERLNFKILLS